MMCITTLTRWGRRGGLSLLLTTLTTPGWAQINPYAPPFPGAVLVQPCGQEAGWVPESHPLAQQTPRICQPPIAPDPQYPWSLRPEDPFELGKVYRNPYGMVLFIVRIQTRLVWNTETGRYVLHADGDALFWDSEYQYYQGVDGRLILLPGAARGVWWEITPVEIPDRPHE